MNRAVAHIPIAAALALLVAACHGSTGPSTRVDATYVLTSVDARALPALQGENVTQRSYLLADTLRFYPDGQYTETVATRVDIAGSAAPDQPQITHGGGEYLFRGDSVYLSFRCGPAQLCALPPLGWRAPDGSLNFAYRVTGGLAWVRRFEPVARPAVLL